MEIAAFVFSVFGFIAFVRVEKLLKTLTQQGVLDAEYKAE